MADVDATGNVVTRYSFDAFGKVRNPNGSETGGTLSQSRRGFTGHEHISVGNSGLIHMALGQPLNGRVYDATLGRFAQADPTVQFAGASQSYNRYSYTLNNPLSYTDPTGFGTWSDFRDQILNPFSSTSPVNISNRNSIFNPAGRNSIWWGARENFFGVRSNNLGQIMMGRAHMMIPGLYSIEAFNSTHPTSARITTTVGMVACGFTTVFYAVCSAGVSAYSTAVMGGGNSSILKSAAAAYITASVGEYYGNTYSVE